MYLAAVRDNAGTLEQVDATLLGDRVRVSSVAIQAGQILIGLRTFAPADPLCCPSQVAPRAFRLEGKTLQPIAPTAVSTPASIVGVVWRWGRFVDSADAAHLTIADPSRYTLTLHSDATYQARADCNHQSGTYTLDGSRLSLHPGPTTLAECEPGSLYQVFLGRLGQVVTYVQRDDKLILDLLADSGQLLFNR